MSITYKSQGAGNSSQTSGTSLAPACPATVDAGDILIAHVFWEGTSDAPDSPPSGWTLLHGPEVIQTTVARHWVYGRIADGSEGGATVTFALLPLTTNQRAARIYSFAGRVSGTITDCVRGFAATSHSTDPQMPTVTTTIDGSLAVALVAQNDNNAFGSPTGESGGDWVEAVAEYTVALTPGLSLGIETAAMASVGTISGGAMATTNDPCGVIGFEIRESGPPAQDITSAGGIASAEAFGTTKANFGLLALGNIATAEAFGTPTPDFTILALGNIASAEAFGTPALDFTLLALGNIGTGELFGTTTVFQPAPGPQDITDAGNIASLEAFGSPTLDFTLLSVGGIASLENVGGPQLGFTVAGLGNISSAEALGDMAFLSDQFVSDLGGIASDEAFGAGKVNFTIVGLGGITTGGGGGIGFMLFSDD